MEIGPRPSPENRTGPHEETTMSKTAHAGFVALVLLTVAVPLHAQDTAAGWLERMTARTDAGNYKVRFTADMNIAQEDLQAAITMNGSMNYASATRFHTAFDMDVNMGGMAMAVKMKSVADGENFWLEVDSPMMGGKQVMSGTTADLEKIAEMEETNMGGFGGLGQDPIEQIKDLVEKFKMNVKGVESGLVTLHADINDEERSALGELANMGEALQYVTLILDEKEAMPVQLKIGGSQPMLTIDFADYEFFTAGQVVDSDYAYTPPDGVPVNDIGTMFGR
jgi:hypothetical protein